MLLVTALLLAAVAGEPPVSANSANSANPDVSKPATESSLRTASLIDHSPLEKSARGLSVFIKAKIENPSTLFAPQVFARPSGTKRYQGYTMQELRRGKFSARLPSSILNDGSFEYFIEARSEDGSSSRVGSPGQPFITQAYDPPPMPVAATFRTEQDGAEVKIDGDVIGKTPLTIKLAPGPHAITVTAADGRANEQQLDVKPGKKLNVNVNLPEAGGEGGSSLQVLSDPPRARVLVDGALAGTTPYLAPIQPGAHVVMVEADGRLRQERQVNARQGRDVSLSFALQSLPKDPALSIESEPPGALVAIDSKDRGRTPWVGPLTAGPHQVVLKLEGRRGVSTDFQMPKDRDVSLRLELPAGSSSGAPRLTVSSAPSGASVLLDGKDVGLTPWSDEVKPGERKVQIKLAGFKAEDRKVPVAAGRDADVAFSLNREPGPGKLRIESDPPEAQVSIDGTDLGFSPFSGDVPPGEHHLEVTLKDYRSVAQEISLEAGQQLALKLAMQKASDEPVPPLIAVASDPQGAVLAVDGKMIGSTPVKVKSTPGQHEIKLTLDGYTTRTGKINLPQSRDFELRMAISLKPLRGTAVEHNAPDPLELARAQLKRAVACYRQGDWKCALDAYQASYEFKALPELLYNIAQTRRRKGDFKEALAAYRNFAKESPSSKMKAEADKYIVYCEMQLDPDRASTRLAAGKALAENDPNRKSGGAFSNVAVTERTDGSKGGAGDPKAAPADTRAAPKDGQQPAVAANTAGARQQPAAADGAPLFPVDEDTDPPLITHTKVEKAIRGQNLRINARIIDERSDVANAQACWKNLFKSEYQCAPLIKVGADDFAVEVPAKAVSDGFSYYLEAYDSAENGPAGSGAPELPHAVIIEEAPPPKPALLAAAESARAENASARDSVPGGALGLDASGKPGGQGPAVEQPKNHLLTWIALGGAAAAVGAGVGLNYHARQLSDSLTRGSHPQSEINSIRSQANTEQTVGYLLFGFSGAFAVGAVAFWNTSF